MVDAWFLLNAMNGIGPEEVREAGSFLQAGKSPRLPRRRRLWTAALAAALLALLFSAFAYAQGWFGLSGRVTASESSSPYAPQEGSVGTRGYMASNGYADSPESLAGAEWQRVYWEMADEALEHNSPGWPEDMGEYAQTAMIYGAFDQEMLDALLSIGDRYGLAIHTAFLHLGFENEHFTEDTGVGAFLTRPDLGDDWSCHCIFEDGSFKGEGGLHLDGKELLYSLERYKSGMVDPYAFFVKDTADFEEWQLELDGRTLELALAPDVEWPNGYIFYRSGDLYVTVRIDSNPLELRDGRLFGEDLSREALEALAARFDYAELTGENDNN